MIEYQVQRNHDTHELLIVGNFPEGCVPVNIPNDNAHRKGYISLFLHKKDIEAVSDFLDCMNEGNPYRMNEGLFIAALSLLFKCFQHSNARDELNADEFKAFSPNSGDAFDIFRAWRNKHYIHDENGMNQAVAFFIVTPEGNENVFAGPASVIWQTASVNHLTEKENLKILLSEVKKFICNKIDTIGDLLIEQYKGFSRQELLTLGEATLPDANTDNPTQKRKV